MITTLTDGLNPLPALGNSKVSRSVKDASAPNFADAMQNLSTEREPASSSVVDEDSVSPAVSQENALSSELRDEPDPNEQQHAMDESTMDMIKSGQGVAPNPVKPATNVSADAAAVLSVGGTASTDSLAPGGFDEAMNGLVASPMVPVPPTAADGGQTKSATNVSADAAAVLSAGGTASAGSLVPGGFDDAMSGLVASPTMSVPPTIADGGQTRLAMPAVQGAQMSAEGLESASIKASVASPLDSVMVAGDAKSTVNALQDVSALVGESLRTSRSGNAVQSDARVESFVDKTPLSVAAAAITKADSNVSSSRVLDLPSRVSANESQQFGNAMATHVRVLKNQGGGEAKVNLHPAELGRMSISVTTDGNETRVAFVVETSQARQAVEAAMPRLRDMLDSAGLSLSDSDVSERRDQQADTNEDRFGASKAEMTSLHGDDGIEATVVSVSVDPDRLIDIYT
jgi:flagellar hook-length control protein FliK